VKPAPTRIEPIFSPRIWGSRSLAPLYPDKTNLAEPLGEAWLTGLDCRIASGPFAGKTLGSAWHEMPGGWRGKNLVSTMTFPILVKFIFPTEKLSIQVHPDDEYAAAHEQAVGGRGKTEMWHAVSAEPNAQVLVGLEPGASEATFRSALDAGTLENLFESHAVQSGDTFFIPAGTPHTIGPGMVLCEVQEYSDLTYRVYDYGRVDAQGKPRELHIDKALEVMNFKPAPSPRVSPVSFEEHGAKIALLAACRHFATERWEIAAQVECYSDPAHFDIYVILSGHGKLNWPDGSATYRPGETWLIPASLGSFTLNPSEPTALVRTYVPDLGALRAALRMEGTTDARIAEVLFD
jgi:mannose-6-phosphate isomerase